MISKNRRAVWAIMSALFDAYPDSLGEQELRDRVPQELRVELEPALDVTRMMEWAVMSGDEYFAVASAQEFAIRSVDAAQTAVAVARLHHTDEAEAFAHLDAVRAVVVQ